MFDVGLSEMMVIGVVALLVIGPEKLPRVARTIGALMGRAQRYVSDVKADISREIELDELKKMQTTVTEAAQSLQTSVKETMAGFEAQASEISKLASDVATPAAEASPPSADALAAADETIRQSLAAIDPVSQPAEHSTQASLALEEPAVPAATLAPAPAKAG